MSCEYADIKVSPDSLFFEVDEGWGFIPPYQYINVDKAGVGKPAHWEINVDGPLVRASPVRGQASSRIRVGCESIGKPAGTYVGSITITSHVKVDHPIILIQLVVKAKEIPIPEPDPEPEIPPEPDPEPEPEPPPPLDPEPEPEPDPDPDVPLEPPCWLCRFSIRMLRMLRRDLG